MNFHICHRNHWVGGGSAKRGLSLPLGRGVCETKSQKGRSRHRKSSLHKVYSALRGTETMVSECARPECTAVAASSCECECEFSANFATKSQTKSCELSAASYFAMCLCLCVCVCVCVCVSFLVFSAKGCQDPLSMIALSGPACRGRTCEGGLLYFTDPPRTCPSP